MMMMDDDEEDIVTYEYEPCKEATVVFDEHDVPGNKRKSTFPVRKTKMIMMVVERPCLLPPIHSTNFTDPWKFPTLKFSFRFHWGLDTNGIRP